jgi:hypothetical protein
MQLSLVSLSTTVLLEPAHHMCACPASTLPCQRFLPDVSIVNNWQHRVCRWTVYQQMYAPCYLACALFQGILHQPASQCRQAQKLSPACVTAHAITCPLSVPRIYAVDQCTSLHHKVCDRPVSQHLHAGTVKAVAPEEGVGACPVCCRHLLHLAQLELSCSCTAQQQQQFWYIVML